MAINMAYSLVQILKMKRFLYNVNRFGKIDHNEASRVSKFTEKKTHKNKQTDQQYYFMLSGIRYYGLELMGSYTCRHAALHFFDLYINAV